MAIDGVTEQEWLTEDKTTKTDVVPANLGDYVAMKTESPMEAKIDAANGLRHSGGRRPTEADFEGLLTPEGNSGDVFGAAISDNPFAFGETGSTGGTI